MCRRAPSAPPQVLLGLVPSTCWGGAVTPNLGTTSGVSTLREDAGDGLGEQEVGLRGTYDLHPWGEETAEGRTLPSPWQGSLHSQSREKEKKSQQLSPFHTPLQWKNPLPPPQSGGFFSRRGGSNEIQLAAPGGLGREEQGLLCKESQKPIEGLLKEDPGKAPFSAPG